ncbi:histone deacetylase [Malassezia pachydermatis]
MPAAEDTDGAAFQEAVPAPALSTHTSMPSTPGPAPGDETSQNLPRTPPAAEPPTPAPSKAAALDILLAPSVLRHRYVRGVDKSNIVERPERIRAVLLGIAGVQGMGEKLAATKPKSDDDVAAMLAGMSIAERESVLRVFTTTRTLRLSEPSVALADVHAHESEPATYDLTTAYAPTSAATETASAKHCERISQLAAKAPSHPPGDVPRYSSLDGALSDASSSDGEGDERMHESEIPASLPQGDLYLCGPHAEGLDEAHDGGSREAICHALGASVEAVDRVVEGAKASPALLEAPQVSAWEADVAPTTSAHATRHYPAKRAFVLSRPPGHHCSGAEPSGFCWVNNAMVATAHAYEAHGIDRVVILDIDLHHGNGTQALAWRRNAAAAQHDTAWRARVAAEARSAHRGGTAAQRQAVKAAEAARTPYEQLLYNESVAGRRAQNVFYGSVHDIESYPCENGDPDLVRNASVCLAGAHGQWIWNVHLDTHRDDADFDEVYRTKYAQLFAQARRFLRETHAVPPRTLVVISCGFDACTYEYPGMQRHGKHVPPHFYARFAQDAAALADEYAEGKLISLLEGGYSDRALTSGTLAHIGALAALPWAHTAWPRAQAPWRVENLMQLERMAKRVMAEAAAHATQTASATRPRRTTQYQPWIIRASEYFAAFQQACGIDARPLTLTPSATTTPRRAVLRGLDLDLATPSRVTAGGHALRDRSVRRRQSHAAISTEPTPARARASARSRNDGERGTSHDPAQWVPGALPVESAGPATPAAPTQRPSHDADTLATLLGQWQLNDTT